MSTPSPDPTATTQALAVPDKFSTRQARAHIVQTLIELGDDAAMRQFQLSWDELRSVQQSDWWSDCAKEYYAAEGARLDRKLTSLIDKSLALVEERIREGDEVVDRMGDTHNVAIKARDLAGIAKDLMDKRQVLRGLPGSIIKAEINLNSLADKLRKFAGKNVQVVPE